MAKKNPAVLWSVEQSLDKVNKETARANIGINFNSAADASGNTLTFVSSIDENATTGDLTYNTKSVTVDQSYSGTSSNPASGKSIKEAIDGLDATNNVTEGHYITAVNETDGKVSLTTVAMDTSPAQNSKKPVTSGGVWDAIDSLDATNAVTEGNYITAVNETNGIVSLTTAAMDTSPTQNSKKPVTSGGVAAKIANMAYQDSEETDKYVTSVSEANGVISVTKKTIAKATHETDGLMSKEDKADFDSLMTYINYGSFELGGKTYRTVIIGDLEWMVDNLDYTDTNVVDRVNTWYYNNDATTYGHLGRLYTYDAAVSINNILVDGWRVPTKDDFDGLINYVDRKAENLMAKTEWDTYYYNPCGVDLVGFELLPAGLRDNVNGERFMNYRVQTYLRSITKLSGSTTGYALNVFYNRTLDLGAYDNTQGYSIRLCRPVTSNLRIVTRHTTTEAIGTIHNPVYVGTDGAVMPCKDQGFTVSVNDPSKYVRIATIDKIAAGLLQVECHLYVSQSYADYTNHVFIDAHVGKIYCSIDTSLTNSSGYVIEQVYTGSDRIPNATDNIELIVAYDNTRSSSVEIYLHNIATNFTIVPVVNVILAGQTSTEVLKSDAMTFGAVISATAPSKTHVVTRKAVRNYSALTLKMMNEPYHNGQNPIATRSDVIKYSSILNPTDTWTRTQSYFKICKLPIHANVGSYTMTNSDIDTIKFRPVGDTAVNVYGEVNLHYGLVLSSTSPRKGVLKYHMTVNLYGNTDTALTRYCPIRFYIFSNYDLNDPTIVIDPDNVYAELWVEFDTQSGSAANFDHWVFYADNNPSVYGRTMSSYDFVSQRLDPELRNEGYAAMEARPNLIEIGSATYTTAQQFPYILNSSKQWVLNDNGGSANDRLYDYVAGTATKVYGWRFARSKVPSNAANTVSYSAIVTIRRLGDTLSPSNEHKRQQGNTIYAYLAIQQRGGSPANKMCMFNALTPYNNIWGLYSYDWDDGGYHYTDWYIANSIDSATDTGKDSIGINLDMIVGAGINCPTTDTCYFNIFDGWEHDESGVHPWDDTAKNYQNRRTVDVDDSSNSSTDADKHALTLVMRCSNAPFFEGHGVGSESYPVYVDQYGEVKEVGILLEDPLNHNIYNIGTTHHLVINENWLNSAGSWWNSPELIQPLCSAMHKADTITLYRPMSYSASFQYSYTGCSNVYSHAGSGEIYNIYRYEFYSGTRVTRYHIASRYNTTTQEITWEQSASSTYPFAESFELLDTSGNYGNEHGTIYLL